MPGPGAEGDEGPGYLCPLGCFKIKSHILLIIIVDYRHSLIAQLIYIELSKREVVEMPRRQRKKRSAMQVAKLALSRSRPIRLRFINTQSSDAMAATWTQTLVNGIALGDQEFNREGDRCLIKEIGIRYTVTATAALDAVANYRVLLVQDKQSNGAAFSESNLFIQDNSLKNFRDPTLSPSRFRVLYDKTYTLEEYAANSSIANSEFKQFYRKYKSPLKMRYNGAGSTVSSIDSGAIWLLFITDRVNNFPSINWQTLVRFYSP